MALTDITIRNAKAAVTPYKLYDGKGLYVLVHSNGSKYWRLRYRIANKEKLFALGLYPAITLAQAREKAFQAKSSVKEGFDPVQEQRVKRAANLARTLDTFKAVASEWLAKNSNKWMSNYANKVSGVLHRYVFPRIGNVPVTNLTAPMLIDAVRPIEARGATEQAARALRWISAIMRYGIVTGRLERNPIGGIRQSDVLAPRKSKSFPSLKHDELGDFLRKLADYPGTPETRIAVKFLLLTFVRTGELRAAKWNEFDYSRQEWRVPAERMKMKAEHIVPLAEQSLALLTELKKLTGHSPYLFPGGRRRFPYMSENTINKAIAMIGYKGRVVGHGFRATASTILNESGLFNPDAIERQLAHKEQNEIRAAYHRAEYLVERRKMMQWWAKTLDTCQYGVDVLPLARHSS